MVDPIMSQRLIRVESTIPAKIPHRFHVGISSHGSVVIVFPHSGVPLRFRLYPLIESASRPQIKDIRPPAILPCRMAYNPARTKMKPRIPLIMTYEYSAYNDRIF
jgi:hypothetical protein